LIQTAPLAGYPPKGGDVTLYKNTGVFSVIQNQTPKNSGGDALYAEWPIVAANENGLFKMASNGQFPWGIPANTRTYSAVPGYLRLSAGLHF